MAIYWLTDGLTSTAARVIRVALLPYLFFYRAPFDAVVGLSNGLVVKYGSELPPAEQAVLIGSAMSLQTWYINLARDALSHRDLVLGSHRHRGRSCVEPSRSAANCNDSIGSGRSDCTTFGPV